MFELQVEIRNAKQGIEMLILRSRKFLLFFFILLLHIAPNSFHICILLPPNYVFFTVYSQPIITEPVLNYASVNTKGVWA